MLFDAAVGVHVMQVAVVQIVDMVLVFEAGVPTIGAVLVSVVCVNVSHGRVLAFYKVTGKRKLNGRITRSVESS
jgi:hypothetical protein